MSKWIYRVTKHGWGGWVLHEETVGAGEMPGMIQDAKMANVWWAPVPTAFQSHGHSDGATTVIVTRDDGAFECPISVLLEKQI